MMICQPESGIWGQLSADLARSVATAGAGRVSESDLQRERPGSAEAAQPQNEDSEARPRA